MPENVEVIFENRTAMMRKLKKKSYEINMQSFRDEHGHFFDEMLKKVNASEDKAAASLEVGKEFADKIFDAYNTKGKIRGAIQADLNLFMIYYVFPAVLLTEDESAKELCDGLKTAWNNRFDDTNISYTDYATLYNSFRDKIFGMF